MAIEIDFVCCQTFVDYAQLYRMRRKREQVRFWVQTKGLKKTECWQKNGQGKASTVIANGFYKRIMEEIFFHTRAAVLGLSVCLSVSV